MIIVRIVILNLLLVIILYNKLNNLFCNRNLEKFIFKIFWGVWIMWMRVVFMKVFMKVSFFFGNFFLIVCFFY